ncbi:glutathione S-transferase family protein [Rhodoplanes sp. Z2-YC6860]|uniref:glutathione S-transferase family protein n=1 Tax=Rhodoplanes sp. Z2-YC6860 TaxID=674703 RepID=UPI00078E94F1|nr:glutathione S-transferase family protein [Rhodoplanes sp. Z2-YC6860]AMN39990.1 glutathione S-transferase [Rhodoplanes sp. Z2-YC6860]
MAYTLLYHPLSSYCMKVLTALYESGTPFTPKSVNLQDEAERAALLKLWPVGKFPVLRDEDRDLTVPESTIIIEHLAHQHPAAASLLPSDPKLALAVRAQDRFYDLYVHNQMQEIVGDRLRPANAKDPTGVESARKRLATSYDMIERDMASKAWATGGQFTMADCAAAPALFYGNKVQPFEATHPKLAAYFGRLKERPSFKRALEEAQPYMKFFPTE